jgi:hypothetical protein
VTELGEMVSVCSVLENGMCVASTVLGPIIRTKSMMTAKERAKTCFGFLCSIMKSPFHQAIDYSMSENECAVCSKSNRAGRSKNTLHKDIYIS